MSSRKKIHQLAFESRFDSRCEVLIRVHETSPTEVPSKEVDGQNAKNAHKKEQQKNDL